MEQLNWRDDEWRDTFFSHFLFDLRFCDSEYLEPNPQNTVRYNETRGTCQGTFRYYLPRVERIVNEMETTQTPWGIVDNIRSHLENIIRQPIFEGIVDEVSERVLPEDLQLPNPMLRGNNQVWSETSLVNHFNRLYNYYLRVIRYLNSIVEGGRKKYRKNRKIRRSRKIRKSRKTKKERKSKKQKKI